VIQYVVQSDDDERVARHSF